MAAPRTPRRWQLGRLQTIAVLCVLQGCDVEGDVGAWTLPMQPSASAPDADADAAAGSSDAAGPVPDAGEVPINGGAISAQGAAPEDAGTPARADACALARGAGAPLDVTVVDTQQVTYNFAQDATFPAGRYRVAYVDGCRRYDNTGAWTIHASVLAAGLSPQGRGGCYLVMSNDQALGLAPGSAGVVVGEGEDPLGAYASYDECVAANLKTPPYDFSFTGGTLGVMNAGDSSPDKTSGEEIGRRSPTYRLTRLDDCP